MSDIVPAPGWRRRHHLRRGGWFTDSPVPAPPAAKASAFLTRYRTKARTVLAHAKTDPVLAEAGRATLDDPAHVSPLGLATVIAAAVGASDPREAGPAAERGEPWAVRHGLPLAAEAAVALAGIRAYAQLSRRQATDMIDTQPYHGWADVHNHFSGGIRARLATASDEDHAAAEAALTRWRDDGIPLQRLMTSFLMPHRQDWVDEDLEMIQSAHLTLGAGVQLLFSSVRTRAQLEAVVISPFFITWTGGSLTSLVEGVGADALPRLLSWFEEPWVPVEGRRRTAAMIAALPSDAAFQALLDRSGDPVARAALEDASARYPRRALRLAAQLEAADLLSAQVSRSPALAADLLPELPAPAADRVRAALAATAAAPSDAPADRVPALLIDPPWTRPVPKPVVVAGLRADHPAEVHWLPGEREEFAGRGKRYFAQYPEIDFAVVAAQMAEGRRAWHTAAALLAHGPAELAVPALGHWKALPFPQIESWLPPILARYETGALNGAVRIGADAAPYLLPFTGPEVAALMTDLFARKALRRTVLDWVARHPAAAARDLIPTALGRPGPARRAAEAMLLTLDKTVVRKAAEGYGVTIDSLLDRDPLSVLPTAVPALPAWADPATLPRIALRDGSGALPRTAVAHLLTMLAISKPGAVYPGVRIVTETLVAGDLAEFGWALFQRWQAAGSPSTESWALDALGLLGDDETVRRLTPVIRAWPGEGGHSKAVAGLTVLASIGTGVALMHLHGIAQRVTFKALKDRAGEKIAEVADAMGLTAAQLADRLVPDLGLSADGAMRLDYGPRQFVVGFDEQLKPYVTDAAGKRLKALPKPGVKDDPAAYARFTTLKKDVRTLAAGQVQRLEQAMVDGRRWTGAEFREFLAGHPLLWHLVRRLVWRVVDGPAFRVAEDRSLATVDDTTLTVADDAMITLPHPAETDLAPWAEVFADYELLQPFPQIAREVFTHVEDFTKVTVPVGRVLGLESRGWRRGTAEDNGVQNWIERPAGDGLTAAIMLDPGIAVGALDVHPEQTLEEIVLLPGPAHFGWRHDGIVPWDRLSPTAVSELNRELRTLTAG